MEDSLAFVTLPHASAAFNCEAAKLGFTKTTELESAMVFGLDAFEVDDLLEFFDKEIGPAIGEVELSDLSAESSVTIMAPEGAHTTYSSTKARSKASYIRASDEEDHHLGTDYDFAELDWLSKFVEDSYSTGEHLKPDLFPAVSDKRPQMSTSADEMKITNPVSVLQNSNTNSAETSRLEINIPGRARSKRCRSGVRIWSSDILTSNSASQESSIYDTSFISFDSSELYSDLYSADSDGVGSRQDIDAVQLSKLTKERKYRRKESKNTQNTRRCAHCLTERTPQWRAGPTGPKTLCNACGVRYKSGRLVPEYRPAASPTFLSDVHSNSHRKVLEMRRQKEINVCTNMQRIFKAN